MEKTPLDLGMLPEPLRNLLQNIDPATLEQIKAGVDPAALMGFFSSAIEFMRQSLSEQDNQALNQLLANVMQLMNQQGKS
ncbi:hypothetical protein G7K71_00590 [Desulfofundulus sp. TPOSR]|jgi:hypothetical protein|uniref:Uncharacterized protein n=1 Tax=Desulfofundulus kuznetsovii (strain DSM 6115 / VKM B-1805 / 17) TaxID=760568 RepID=A0AAU8PCM9_DESK7|nr:hypothetical protein [Desulfofundulus sp. TPOSR]AEG15021.1 hypothetical protein Desku_1438 [Desulfofundulus kuznetsovii DSM 6115]NHM25534.1 hypothetical protein [Desulfofundulus sp. TPOSR]